MLEGVEIRGGADEFEAAVIAVVLDHITQQEQAARVGRPDQSSALPAWVQAVRGNEWVRENRWSPAPTAQPRLVTSLNSGERSR